MKELFKKIRETVGSALSLAFGIFGILVIIALLVPIAIPVVDYIVEYWTAEQYILIISAVLLVFTVVHLRAFLKRKAYIRELSTLCRKKGYKLTAIKKPYRSLFRIDREENFRVEVLGITYSCKFLPTRNRLAPLILHQDGRAEFPHKVGLGRVVLFRYSSIYSFSYESEHRRILIVNPVPKFVHASYKGKTSQIDNGDVIGDYKFYTASAFLRALERDVLDR